MNQFEPPLLKTGPCSQTVYQCLQKQPRPSLGKLWSPRVGFYLCPLAKLNPALIDNCENIIICSWNTSESVLFTPKVTPKPPERPVTMFHTQLIFLLKHLCCQIHSSPQIHSVRSDKIPILLLSPQAMYWHVGALSKCLSNTCPNEQDLLISIGRGPSTANYTSFCSLFQASCMAVYYVPGEVLDTENKRKKNVVYILVKSSHGNILPDLCSHVLDWAPTCAPSLRFGNLMVDEPNLATTMFCK